MRALEVHRAEHWLNAPRVNAAPVIPANPVRDFRSPRRARQARLRDRLRTVIRPLALLAAALAVPALAANSPLALFAEQDVASAVAPMPFEIAGESFPGSAFYYLDDAPQLVETATRGAVRVIGEAAPVEGLAANALAAVPLAASPLRIVGTGRDHMRAQECMTQAIYYEAASESDAGQRAVAQVVLNRVAHAAYPNTVCGVVYQGSERSTGCQFTFTCDGSLRRVPSQAAWARASRIAREALAGVVYAPVGTATHYHTLAVNPYWASSLDTVGVIGAHIFYRWRGAAGRPEAFRAGYAGGEPAAARSRASTPEAPDPIAAPILSTGPAATFAPMPAAAPVQDTAASVAPDPAGGVLPASGAVRQEYANAGRWIERD